MFIAAVEKEREILQALETDEQQLMTSSAAAAAAAATGGSAGVGAMQPHLQQILSSMKSSSSSLAAAASQREQRAPLSRDAERVLSSLQDYSFMRAKVLMFPLSGGEG